MTSLNCESSTGVIPCRWHNPSACCAPCGRIFRCRERDTTCCADGGWSDQTRGVTLRLLDGATGLAFYLALKAALYLSWSYVGVRWLSPDARKPVLRGL